MSRKDSTCLVDSCDRKVLAKSMCSMHYGRMMRGKPLSVPNKKTWTADQLFDGRGAVTTESGCIVWGGGKDHDGYGIFTLRGKSVRAHRYIYEREVGDIPEGMLVCHTCDNPPCINPKHLFLGTPKDNTQDMHKKKRFPIRRGNKHHYAILTDEIVIEARTSALTTAVLARKHGVPLKALSAARIGRGWNHVGVAARLVAKHPNRGMTDG